MSDLDINDLINAAPKARQDYLRRKCAELISNDAAIRSQGGNILSLKKERERRHNGQGAQP